MPSARDLKLMAVLSGLFLGLAAAVLLGGVDADLLLVAPLVVLVVPLFGGRYVGEGHLHRLRLARAVPARRPAAVAPAAPRRAPLRVLCAGLLLARTHASRPPPSLAIA
jgi:hypothetical protein